MSESQAVADQQQAPQAGSQPEGLQGSQGAGGQRPQDRQGGAVQQHPSAALAR